MAGISQGISSLEKSNLRGAKANTKPKVIWWYQIKGICTYNDILISVVILTEKKVTNVCGSKIGFSQRPKCNSVLWTHVDAVTSRECQEQELKPLNVE